MTQPPKQNRQLAGTDVRWRAMEAWSRSIKGWQAVRQPFAKHLIRNLNCTARTEVW